MQATTIRTFHLPTWFEYKEKYPSCLSARSIFSNFLGSRSNSLRNKSIKKLATAILSYIWRWALSTQFVLRVLGLLAFPPRSVRPQFYTVQRYFFSIVLLSTNAQQLTVNTTWNCYGHQNTQMRTSICSMCVTPCDYYLQTRIAPEDLVHEPILTLKKRVRIIWNGGYLESEFA